MSFNALYTDLSGYYDLMCADIDYQTQSHGVIRLQQFFGNGGRQHLDLACGTGPHIEHFLTAGFQCTGLDLNQPMLDLARQRCPQAQFLQQNICDFQLEQPVDLITCFLYSLHYAADTQGLTACIRQVLAALKPGGVFCFNAVDKDLIDNNTKVRHSASQIANNEQQDFIFESGWFYTGLGDKQSLNLRIAKTSQGVTQQWQDQHPMVAVNFAQLRALLEPAFEVILLEHDYEKIVPWNQSSGNALFICIKK
ncbi:class I SAM-dependent methyltransferase [Rheinheimera riviphila]|uniref:Class I SAM-dependent methyltransferase n=1 Tax=Rheinheimera riviphila TaxID=1834037 RepID=A0A437R5F6_9GAMM|nr:class I SAM-dependent methyltransferase [Rheinheimera riviphila]RVU42004.1 class I SAM-dependent methyltransferase [Rheinheimera riviphila]